MSGQAWDLQREGGSGQDEGGQAADSATWPNPEPVQEAAWP